MTVAGRRYVDGGVRSIANADLAVGCNRVVVLAPVNFALKPSLRISHQLKQLGDGVTSVVVSPDAAARQAIGTSVLSPARRAGAARAGREQGAAIVELISSVWSSAVTT
jgi:NTE family protein